MALANVSPLMAPPMMLNLEADLEISNCIVCGGSKRVWIIRRTDIWQSIVEAVYRMHVQPWWSFPL